MSIIDRFLNAIKLNDDFDDEDDFLDEEDDLDEADAPEDNVKPRKRPTTPEEWAAMIPSFGYVGTAAGNTILRGAIIGQGDMDMWKIISIIKNSGYEKEISLEDFQKMLQEK